MKRLRGGAVFDTSVAVKLVLSDEPHSALADMALRLAAHYPALIWAVPDLFDVECANVIRTSVLRHRLHIDQGARALDALLELPLRRVATRHLSVGALALALGAGVSVYDACYVALAELLGAPFVTADRRLVKATAPAGHDVIFLGDLRA